MLLAHVGAIYEQRAAADDHEQRANAGNGKARTKHGDEPGAMQPTASQPEREQPVGGSGIGTHHPGSLFAPDTSNRHAALLSYSLAKTQFQTAIRAGNVGTRSDLAGVFRRLQGLRRGAECSCRSCVLQQHASGNAKSEQLPPHPLAASHSDTIEDAVLCRDMADLCHRMEIDNLQHNFLHGFGWVTAHSTDLIDALALYKEALWLRATIATSPESVADADLLALIADVQLELNDHTGALEHLTEAKRIRTRAGTLMSNDGAALLHALGHAFGRASDRCAAVASYREALQARIESRTLNCESGALLYRDIAAVEWKRGDLDAAAEAFDAAYTIRRETDTLDTTECIDLLTDAATLRHELGDDVGALELFYAAKTIATRIDRDDAADALTRQIQDVSVRSKVET